jgi:hypothetical protein
MPTSRFQRTFTAATVACAFVCAPATAQPPPPRAAGERTEAASTGARLAAIEAGLERIAAALEEQAELARLDVIARRVEAGNGGSRSWRGRAPRRALTCSPSARGSRPLSPRSPRRVGGSRPAGRPVRAKKPSACASRPRPASSRSTPRSRLRELSVTGLDERADRLRQEVAAWSALLEAELGPPIPAAEEAEEPEAATSAP